MYMSNKIKRVGNNQKRKNHVTIEEELLKKAIEALDKGDNELVKEIIRKVRLLRKMDSKPVLEEKIKPVVKKIKVPQNELFLSCNRCGREMPFESIFCDKCGFRLR